jgi:tubulin gamma
MKKYINEESLRKYFLIEKNLIKNSNGRGNNWALGYDINFKEFKQEKSLVQDSFEKINFFIEKCDFLKGFMFIHSLYGGTGSGISTRLIEMLRDEYPKFNIIDVAIKGLDGKIFFIYFNYAKNLVEKTTLSYYNKFFTIGHIYEHVDSIFLLDVRNK